MPGDLRVSLRLTAEDLMSPQIVEALTKLQVLEQATLRINNGQQAAAGGAQAHAAAQAELAEKAGLSTVALEHATEVGTRFGEEFVAGAARIGASLISFELLVGTYEKITEAAREAEVANRQLTARFGEAAGEYREFSEAAAAGTNFTAVQFERASATLQPLIRDYGLTDEQIKELLGTTADLAAANRVDLVQASTDVVGVMRGMTRAGAELGLNLRTNVIQSMDGLSDSEKRAVAEGDTLGGAQARLHAVMLEAAGAQGQAAKSASETGDQFARLDGATAKLYETLASSGAVQGLTRDLADAATAANNLLLIERLLQQQTPEGYQYGGRAGAQYRAEQEAARARAASAALALSGAQATGMTGTPRESFGHGSAGVPPLDEMRRLEEARRAESDAYMESEKHAEILAQEAERDEAERIERVTQALHQRTAAQEEAIRTGTDFRDETTRAIEAQRSYGTELERSAQKVADLDRAMQASERNRSQLGGYEKALTEDRALRRRLGLPELAGETDALRQAYKVDYQNRLAEGPEALAALLGHLRAGDFDAQTVQVDTQTVTAGTVIVNGQAQGGGNQSSISGGVGPWATARWSAARGAAYDPRTMGIGRAIG